jgi:hypothetical protein
MPKTMQPYDFHCLWYVNKPWFFRVEKFICIFKYANYFYNMMSDREYADLMIP